MTMSGFGVLAAVFLVGCGQSTEAREPTGVTPPRSIGEPCRSNADCITGAKCQYFSCDFSAPCRAGRTGQDGDLIYTYRFDSSGRSLGFDAGRGQRNAERQKASWSDDSRVRTTSVSVGEDAPHVVVTDKLGRARDVLERTLKTSTGMTQTTHFTYASDWSCRAPRWHSSGYVGTRSTTEHVRCDDKGNPIVVEYAESNGRVASDRYTYRDGRVVEYLTSTSEIPIVVKVLRDARGAVTELHHDIGANGNVDTREIRDLSCWQVMPDRVVYAPSAR
jgi:hypothetical protein